jgi:pimeloyl-ACP methyl ester carboxylesterase
MESTPIEFISGGSLVRGQFFSAEGKKPVGTLVLVPGWPGEEPCDVLGLGALLSPAGVNVLAFNPRGLQQSEGTASFPHTFEDIKSALSWARQPDVRERFRLDADRIALGGHSYGGGMALAYAASDPSVRRVMSFAGNDHGYFIRRVLGGPPFPVDVLQFIKSTRAPEGPARFDNQADLQELAFNQDVYGLRENAGRLADRAILLCGGWEDRSATVEDVLLPLYRSLKAAGAANVTFLVYHANHGFEGVHERLADDVRQWLVRHLPEQSVG